MVQVRGNKGYVVCDRYESTEDRHPEWTPESRSDHRALLLCISPATSDVDDEGTQAHAKNRDGGWFGNSGGGSDCPIRRNKGLSRVQEAN